MNSNSYFLDLGAWASAMGPVFRRALDPATPVSAHRDLAEKVSEYLEEGALLGDRAADAEIPWRALMAGDLCFLALEDGFAMARFDAANLISLRVESYDGSRWSVLHTGRGLAAFRQAAMGRGSAAGADPAIKIQAFDGQRLRLSTLFHPNGSETDELGGREFPAAPLTGTAGSGLEQPVHFGPELIGAGALLMRRALASLEASRPPAEPVAMPAEPAPLSAASLPPPEPLSTLQEAEQALLGSFAFPPLPAAKQQRHWRLVGLTGPLSGQVLRLATQSVVIGRDPAADIHIENPTVSRRHAELRSTENGWLIEDLESANGTWIAGSRLNGPVLLVGGEHFRLGECAFLLDRG